MRRQKNITVRHTRKYVAKKLHKNWIFPCAVLAITDKYMEK